MKLKHINLTGRKKGNVLITLAVVVVLGLLGLGMFAYINALTQTEKARQFAIEQGLQQLPTTGGTGTVSGVTTGIQGQGIYGYEGVKPYVNWFFKDDQGNAENPTCYFYDDPAKSINKDTWDDERAWADDSGTYIDSGTASSGKLQKQWDSGKVLYIHCSLSNNRDMFMTYTVPVRGDLTPGDASDTNAGLSAGTFVLSDLDTTAWTSSAIDMGVSTTANNTNLEHIKDTQYTVAKNKVIDLDRIMLNYTKYDSSSGDLGVRKVMVEIGGVSITVYDDAGGVDRSVYQNAGTLLNSVFDSNNYASIKKQLGSISYSQDQAINIRLRYWMDTNTQEVAGDVENSDVLGRLVVQDKEGNNLIAQNVQG